MKFKDYKYERYSYEAYAEAMDKAGKRLKEAKDYKSFKEASMRGNRHLSIWIQCIIFVMSAIRSIRMMPFIRQKMITGMRQCQR